MSRLGRTNFAKNPLTLIPTYCMGGLDGSAAPVRDRERRHPGCDDAALLLLVQLLLLLVSLLL